MKFGHQQGVLFEPHAKEVVVVTENAYPPLQFGRGGRPPKLPAAAGLGVEIDRDCLLRYRARSWQGRVPEE